MSTKSTPLSETILKLYLPRHLKQSLQNLANERGLTLSALVRLIASEYIKLKK